MTHNSEPGAMTVMPATEAARDPMSRGRGADVKALVGRHRPDAAWNADIAAVRDLLELDDRP